MTEQSRTDQSRVERSLADGRLTDWIQETVDRTATSIEEIHKSIAQIPLDVMRSTGAFEQTAEDVGDVQARSIGAVYDLVRDVNHRVVGLAAELLHPQPDAE